MRWIAAQTVVVMLLCTVFSCTALALPHKAPPPCHQHQKPAAPQSVNPCDHQQAVTVDQAGHALPEALLFPVAIVAAPVPASLMRLEANSFFEHPPGPPIPSSVLRV